MRFGPFRFDPANGFLYRDGLVVALPPRALGVLAVLASRPGQVVPKQTLLDEVWKDTHVSDTSLSEAVSLLRQALGDDPQRGDFIQTVPRRGYRFVAPLEPAPLVAASNPPARSDDEALWTPWLPWLLAVVGGIVLTSVAWSLRPGATPHRETVARFSIALPDGFQIAADRSALAFAPDSSSIALVASRPGQRPVIFVRSLAGAAWRSIAGTQGASAPFFAPDARSLGYFADGQLWRVDLEAGEPRAIAAAPSPAGAVWAPDDAIVFAARWGEGLLRMTASGGTTRAITRLDGAARDARHAWPSIDEASGLVTYSNVRLVDGRPVSDVRGWSASALRTATLLPDATYSHVLPSGHLLAWRRSQPVVTLLDEPTLLAGGLVALPFTSATTLDDVPLVAVSNRGAVVSVADAQPAGIAWITPDGRRIDGPWSPRLTPMALSADGVRLLATSTEGGDAGYRVLDLSRGTEQRMAGLPEPAPGALRTETRVDGLSGLDVVAVRDARVVARVATTADETAAAVSPDESLLSWQSNASGEWQVAIARTSDTSVVDIVAPGTSPAWSRDGRTLWFLQGDTLMASLVDPATAAGQPGRAVATGIARIVGTAPDGRVLVVTRAVTAPALDVVLGWSEEIRARMAREPRLPRSFR